MALKNEYWNGLQDVDPLHSSESYLGVVEPNFWGTQFTLFDAGSEKPMVLSKNEDKTPNALPGYQRNELVGQRGDDIFIGVICIDAMYVLV